MASNTRTNPVRPNDPRPHRNPLFRRLPDQYYTYAVQWCFYPRWTIEETANLLTGCVPHREMFLRGDEHKQLDEEVLSNENRVRAALGKELKVVETKKYFERTCIDSANVIEWARSQGLEVPELLLRAQRETRSQRELHGYLTPCMAAVNWVVEAYWETADLRDPPSKGEIVSALLQEFPDLSPQECEMIEHIARHPVAQMEEP